MAKLTFVGDVDQMMFRFTGAKPELLTGDLVPGVETLFLDINYRSTKQIISTCNKLIAQNYSDLGGPYDQKFYQEAQPRPDAPEGEPVSFQMYPTNRDEAKGVAQTIMEQLAQGYEFGDFFVGSRTRAQLAYLEGELFRNDIKFVNLSGGSFWQNYHVANILGFLRLATNTNDEEAFKKVYNIASADYTDKKGNYCHHHWMGAEFLRLTKSNYHNMDIAIRRNKRYYYGVSDLRNFIEDVQAEVEHSSPADVIAYIIENCYTQWLKAKGENVDDEADSSIIEDLATIKDVASDYDTVEAFLNYVDEMVEAAEAAKKGNLEDFTVLATYHKLKGQERKVVIGIGWCEGEDHNHNPKGLLPHTFSLAPPPQNGVLPTGGMSPVEDERCIGFVCISRAMEKCFLTGCAEYRGYTLWPSRFLTEAGIITTLDVEVSEQEEVEVDVGLHDPHLLEKLNRL